MALREFWVDSVSGSNANPGTRAAPFLDLRHATSTAITAQGVNDTVIVNVIPCQLMDGVEQYIRLDAADWTGGRLVVRSAIPGLPWVVGAGGSRLIWAVGACNATVEIYDCQATTVRILEWAGLTTASATGVRLKIGSGCRFTNSTNSGSGDCFNFDSDASESSLQIDPGVIINRWASLCFGTFLRTVLIDGLTFNSLDGLARTTNIFADSLTIKNSTFRWPTSLNHVFIAQSRLTDLIITDNTFDMLSTNGATSFWFDAPPTGVSSVNCSISGNTFTTTSPAPVVHVGNVLVDTNNRATNDATRGQFASCTITENDIVQRNALGGGLRVMIGTTGAVVTKNYVRTTNLVDAANVHIAYLYGDGIQFRENFVQGSILAFGPNQKIFDNIAVAQQNGLLLGGTQGGSQAIGGGNNYTIGGNILVSVGAACLNDYAYNGAYPTNLGTLTCECNNNVYVPLSGSSGAVQLLPAGLFGTTTEQVRNLWNNSALSGSGSVWGNASNANNDSFSRVATGAELSWYQYLRDSTAGVFTRADFERIREFADMRQAESIVDLTATRITNASVL
jgi:hypothetical protein